MPVFTSLAPTDLVRDLAAFLAHLDEPVGGAPVFDTYTSDAPLYWDGKIQTAAAIGLESFAYGFAAIALRHAREHAGAPRRPQLEALTLLDVRPEADGRAVAWLSARERNDGRDVLLAVGFAGGAGRSRIGWLTLSPVQKPWTYAEGLVETLADYSFAEGGELEAPRSWLDVAYLRHYAYPRPTLHVLPEARFSCQSSGVCCNIGFNVQVSPAAQEVIDRLPWDRINPELAGTKLEPGSPDMLLLKGMDEACRFIDEHKHCMIHKALGRAVFPVCARFPFMFTETPDGVAVTTSAACGSVRANLGAPLLAGADDMYARLAMAPVTNPAPDAFQLAPGVEVAWEVFRDAEAVLLDLLVRRELSLQRRLWLGERHLASLIDGTPPADEHAPLPEAPAAEREAIAAFVAQLLTRLQPSPPSKRSAVHAELSTRQEELLLPLFRNMLFEKAYSYGHDLRLAWHMVILAWALVITMQADEPDGELNDGLLCQTATQFMHNVGYQVLAEGRAGAIALRDRISAPGFGDWLLGLPHPAPSLAVDA